MKLYKLLTEQERRNIVHRFRAMDVNGDGRLTAEEFIRFQIEREEEIAGLKLIEEEKRERVAYWKTYFDSVVEVAKLRTVSDSATTASSVGGSSQCESAGEPPVAPFSGRRNAQRQIRNGVKKKVTIDVPIMSVLPDTSTTSASSPASNSSELLMNSLLVTRSKYSSGSTRSLPDLSQIFKEARIKSSSNLRVISKALTDSCGSSGSSPSSISTAAPDSVELVPESVFVANNRKEGVRVNCANISSGNTAVNAPCMDWKQFFETESEWELRRRDPSDLVALLNDDELKAAYESFKCFDRNNDGSVTREEAADAASVWFKELQGAGFYVGLTAAGIRRIRDTWVELFMEADVDFSGTVTYQEYLLHNCIYLLKRRPATHRSGPAGKSSKSSASGTSRRGHAFNTKVNIET